MALPLDRGVLGLHNQWVCCFDWPKQLPLCPLKELFCTVLGVQHQEEPTQPLLSMECRRTAFLGHTLSLVPSPLLFYLVRPVADPPNAWAGHWCTSWFGIWRVLYSSILTVLIYDGCCSKKHVTCLLTRTAVCQLYCYTTLLSYLSIPVRDQCVHKRFSKQKMQLSQTGSTAHWS